MPVWVDREIMQVNQIGNNKKKKIGIFYNCHDNIMRKGFICITSTQLQRDHYKSFYT